MDNAKGDTKCGYCGGDHLSAQHPIPLPTEPKRLTLEVVKDAKGRWRVPLAAGTLTTIDDLVQKFRDAWPEHPEFTISLHVKEPR